MKGIIFNLIEEVVTEAYGEDTWDALLDATGLDGVYTSLGSYPDDDLFALVKAAASALDVSPDGVLRSLGEGALPLLAERFPAFFEDHAGTRSFLLTLNDIIHAEVRKLYPGADVPYFEFDATDDEVLVMTYRSHRKLCALAEGFIAGAARHYREVAEMEQSTCMHRGAEACTIRCRFVPAGGGGT